MATPTKRPIAKTPQHAPDEIDRMEREAPGVGYDVVNGQLVEMSAPAPPRAK